MSEKRVSVREARRTISQTLNAGKTVTIGPTFGSAHGFLVGIPKHDGRDRTQKKKAISEAKRNFTAAWIQETQR
jgi:hypothetical protein